MPCPALILLDRDVHVRVEERAFPDFRAEAARHVRARRLVAPGVTVGHAAELANVRRIERKRVRRAVADALHAVVTDRLVHELFRRFERRGGRNADESLPRTELRRQQPYRQGLSDRVDQRTRKVELREIGVFFRGGFYLFPPRRKQLADMLFPRQAYTDSQGQQRRQTNR